MNRLPGFSLALAAGCAALSLALPARANILISVDKSAQQMTVTVDGDPRYIWPVSTGRSGYNTPSGQFHPTSMERQHYSRQWDNAPMPYSIFFTNQGHAVHGTNHPITGQAASHGCVRLSEAHAAILYALVKAEGIDKTRVVLTGHVRSPGEMIARNGGDDGNTDTTGDISARASVAPDYNDQPYYEPPPPPPRREYHRSYRRRVYFPFPFPF
jgi:L,D-transpeptidase catalytic domain